LIQGRIDALIERDAPAIDLALFELRGLLSNLSGLEPPRFAPVAPVRAFEGDPVARRMSSLVTPKQLVCINAIANSAGIYAERECAELFKLRPEELNRRAARYLIDHLNARACEVTSSSYERKSA
jgi:hypothetical protein